MGPEGFSKIGAGKDTLPALPVIFQIGAGMVGPEWYRAGTSETRLFYRLETDIFQVCTPFMIILKNTLFGSRKQFI
jgi:hypothetical protein